MVLLIVAVGRAVWKVGYVVAGPVITRDPAGHGTAMPPAKLYVPAAKVTVLAPPAATAVAMVLAAVL